MKTQHLKAIAGLVVLALVFTVSLAAQNEAPEAEAPTWLSITYVIVKPEMDTQFQDLLKNRWLPAVKKADLPMMETWRTVRFGNAFEYAFVSTMKDFAMFDGPSPLQKVMKPAEYAMLYELLRQCVSSVQTVAYWVRADLSFDKRDGQQPKLAVISRTRTEVGKAEEYAKALKEHWLPHVEKLDYPAVFSQQAVFGAASNEWLHVTMIDNFAHLDKGEPLVRAVGEEEARKIGHMFDDLVESDQMTISMLLPEYSLSAE